VSINDGVRRERIVEEMDLDSVPEILDTGRTMTSNVALDAFSDCRRTSMGPETEAIALVLPEIVVNETEYSEYVGQTKCKTGRTVGAVETFIYNPLFAEFVLSSSI
jgi:hypothetical protein